MKLAAELYRVNDNGIETLGNFCVIQGNERTWNVFSLERPWKENEHDISCIPAGTYKCVWSRSSKLSDLAGGDVFTYEILKVKNRAGIRIHSANYFRQLRGCIALGLELGDINKDGQTDVLQSAAAIAKLHELMNGEDFELTIYDVPKA